MYIVHVLYLTANKQKTLTMNNVFYFFFSYF